MKSYYTTGALLVMALFLSLSGSRVPDASAQVNNLAVVASAASFRTEVTPDSLAAVFTNPQVHNTPSNTKVSVRDARANVFEARVLFSSPGQTNVYLPPTMAFGPATITVTDGAGHVSQGQFVLYPVAPGIFAANSQGSGPPAAVILRVRANGVQIYETLGSYDATTGRFVDQPIDLGPVGERVYLVLFGTGIRFARQADVNVWIGGTFCEVAYSGPQGTLLGFDQVNILLPRILAGRGEMNAILGINTLEANRVQISVR